MFTRSGNNWSPQAYLKVSNAEAGDLMGWSVALQGDTIAVGAPHENSIQTTIANSSSLPTAAGDDDSEAQAGAVYVFVRSGNTWSQQAYLKASNSDWHDNLGLRIDLDGDTIVAGVQDDSDQTTISNSGSLPGVGGPNELEFGSGAVWVFVRTGTTWSQQAFLKASNAESLDSLGASVAIDGDTIVAGAQGENSNQTTISHTGSLPTPAGDDDSAAAAGAAYVFVRSGTTWSLQAYLKASNAEAGDAFGTSVAIDGDTVVVGANSEDSAVTTVANAGALPTPAGDDDSAADSGAAYVFVRTGTTWSQQAYLKAPNAEAGDLFGRPVAIDGDTIVVGAYWEDSAATSVANNDALPTPANDDDNALNAGAAYVFERTGTTWSQKAYLKAPNAEIWDSFGTVDISGSTIVSGAFNEDSASAAIAGSDALPTPAGDDDSGTYAGAAYVFELQ